MDWLARDGLFHEMTFGQRPERSKEIGLMNVGGIMFQAEGTASTKTQRWGWDCYIQRTI